MPSWGKKVHSKRDENEDGPFDVKVANIFICAFEIKYEQ